MRFIHSLSGRFLILTVIFVMIAEVLIFVPSIARFRVDYLQERLELSQVASLVLLASPNDMVDPELETELLGNAEVLNIVLRRDAVRELILASDMPQMVEQTYDIRDAGTVTLIWDALRTIVRAEPRVIRVIGMPVKGAGVEIEATLYEAPLRSAMLAYGLNILWLSLFISIVTAALLFLAVRSVLVKPIRRVVRHMIRYRDDPEDNRRIITPRSGVVELRDAELTLADLQTQLTSALKQKERLAGVGGAVSRISHDLRNMLTTATLLADRIEMSDDPRVARTAPKLINSLNRAISLCENTLAFGKAEEPAPQLRPVKFAALIQDVMDSDRLRAGTGEVTLRCDVPEMLEVNGDPEQLYRVFANLIKNAREAIEATGQPGEVVVEAQGEGAMAQIIVRDTGPGLPPKALEFLFKPFKGGARRGGTGLGLAIAHELVKGHGGQLDLLDTGKGGTRFKICLPKAALLPA
ncbi:MAG: HAMP domain-containing sensor histidine kinase [Pseudomonadota bacterium]